MKAKEVPISDGPYARTHAMVAFAKAVAVTSPTGVVISGQSTIDFERWYTEAWRDAEAGRDKRLAWVKANVSVIAYHGYADGWDDYRTRNEAAGKETA